ncbi:MAG: T9SS type A sorting domain-containing protein [Chitinophagales bacterium]|nr:T9SS type A sorting domain-containing protein [Chitinophagales bacterium]
MRRYLPILFALVFGNHLYSQEHTSILQEESTFYQKFKFSTEKEWDDYWKTPLSAPVTNTQKTTTCSIGTKRVFGWHPYWLSSTVHNNYQWNLLSDLCYFDYTISPTTGNNTNASFNWSGSSAVTAAKNNGKKISFCATLFSSHATFFASSTAKQTFINNCISLLQSRGGHGVNLDFEGVPSASKAAMTAFVQDFSNQLKAAIPGAEVTMAVYSVDWNSVFDISNLNNYVDLFIIMGYDYYYSGSSQAGPNGPLYSFQTSYNYSQSRSISYYLKQGVPANKLLLAVPYYGRKWQTVSDAVPSATVGGSANSSSVTYKSMRDNVNGWYNNKKWNNASFTPYFTYQTSGNWNQLWIDDSLSLAKKYDIVNQQGIGGIGMWTLGYDDGYPELWNAIRDKFSDCKILPCSDSIFDMGGPERNHYDNENFTYTITPPGNVLTTLNFSQFELEAGYDSLWLYDGPSVNAPLIGSYSGLTGPGTVNASGASITLRFKSDVATTKPGFKAVYQCTPITIDSVRPTSQVSNPGWVSSGFTASFVDNDALSGIKNRFYAVLDYSNYTWRANGGNGFFNDDFAKTTIHPEWIEPSGIWTSASNRLIQSDESNGNTRLSAFVNQNSDSIFLYHYIAKISGTGTNRRAGLHFMCSSPNLENRGNSYFVYARIDNGGKLQIYETINDTFYLVKDVVFPFQVNFDYDYKIMYNRFSGKIEVYVNDKLITSWIDSTPLQVGNYISFRSGGCNFSVDYVTVYKNRNTTKLVSVGSASSNDIRYSNISPDRPGGRILTLVTDNSNNISLRKGTYINIDFSAPNPPAVVNDGTDSIDIDSQTNMTTLSGNWQPAVDVNSGIKGYYYGIGTAPGVNNVSPWVYIGSATSFTKTGLNLNANTLYYINIKCKNLSGLISTVSSSDGITVFPSSSKQVITAPLNNYAIKIFPNPVSDEVNVSYALHEASTLSIDLFDLSGKKIGVLMPPTNKVSGNHTETFSLGEFSLPAGMYLVTVNINNGTYALKISIQ